MLDAIDHDDDLVQMPLVIWLWSIAPDAACEIRPKPVDPEPHRLAADYNAALIKSDLERDEALAKSKSQSGTPQDAENIRLAARQKNLQAQQALFAADFRADQQQVQLLQQQISSASQVVQHASARIGDSAAAKAMAASAAGVAKIAANWKGLKASAPDAISAVGEVAASVVSGERTKAGILAITEAAAAAASYPNIPGMVAHSAAATLYAAAAAGVIPTASGSGSSGGGSAAAGQSRSSSGQDAAQSSSGPRVVHVHFPAGFVVGTKHEIAQHIVKTVQGIKGTGYAA